MGGQSRYGRNKAGRDVTGRKRPEQDRTNSRIGQGAMEQVGKGQDRTERIPE